MEFVGGNYVFTMPDYFFRRHENTATEWAYNLQHNTPNSQGLAQQIVNCKLTFPARVIPLNRETIIREIPEPTYLAPYVPVMPAWMAAIPSQFDQLRDRTILPPAERSFPIPTMTRAIELPLAQAVEDENGHNNQSTPPPPAPHNYYHHQQHEQHMRKSIKLEPAVQYNSNKCYNNPHLMGWFRKLSTNPFIILNKVLPSC